MAKTESPLIQASEVLQIIQNPDTIIVDARSGPDAQERFMTGHPQGAIHLDLDRDLSQKTSDPSRGGRHPLPDIKTFTRLLGSRGIGPSTQVVIYDDKNGANAAARLWWMLWALGHKNVCVVNGGLDALKKENIPMVNSVSHPVTKSPYPAGKWTLPVVNIDDVAKAVSNAESLVIDVRESYRFKGEREPIDLVAGHIPGAKNIPYIENLDSDGKFRPAETLKDHYQKEIGNRNMQNVIVHCGSGVTACHTLLALEYAGMPGAQLYVGSWSEWSRSNRPIETQTGKHPTT